MSHPNSLTLPLNEITPQDRDSLSEKIARHRGNVRLVVPLPSIGYTNSPIDIADDYADALFVGESLREICPNICWQSDYDSKRQKHFALFDVNASDVVQLVEKLFVLAPWFNSDQFEDAELEEFRDGVSELKDGLPFRQVHFVELADSYMINFLTGISCEYLDEESDEGWQEYFPRQPECRFGYFLSAITNHAGGMCFSSTDDWVLESRVPLAKLLTTYGGVGPESATFLDAESLRIGANAILTNARAAVRFVPGVFDTAKKMLLGSGRTTGAAFSRFEMSTAGDVLVAHLDGWKIVRFEIGEFRLGTNELEGVLKESESSSELLRSCLGRPTSVRCDWGRLSDESFERMCCDVLCQTGRYNPETLEKMGLSRARDGGRDIVIKTYPRSGRSERMFVFQCKKISNSRAVGGRTISVSDVVDQFGATGFGVMTSGLIDATLHDKLSAIARTRKIEIDKWDQLRLERFLAEWPNIRDRYFDRDGSVRSEA